MKRLSLSNLLAIAAASIALIGGCVDPSPDDGVIGCFINLEPASNRCPDRVGPRGKDGSKIEGQPVSMVCCADPKSHDSKLGLCYRLQCPTTVVNTPPTCSDGVMNQDETAIDCGGVCGGCYGSACTADAQCRSDAQCAPTSNLCTKKEGSCSDGAKDGVESDVDCGKLCSTKCTAGKQCLYNSDCASELCNGANTMAAPQVLGRCACKADADCPEGSLCVVSAGTCK